MVIGATFSSPTGAFLISIIENLKLQKREKLFSSPTGAFLISMNLIRVNIYLTIVFVLYRGFPNLNSAAVSGTVIR